MLVVGATDAGVLPCAWALRRGGWLPEFVRHDTRAGFEAALAAGSWDVVLTSPGVAGLAALDALAAVRRHGSGIPVVAVVDDDCVAEAVALLKAGAADCVTTTGLDRLPEAVGDALRAASERLAAGQRDRACRSAAQRASEAVAGMPGVVFQLVREPDGVLRFTYVSPAAEAVLGVPPDVLLDSADEFLARIDPRERPAFDLALARSADALADGGWEGRLADSGSRDPRWVRLAWTARAQAGDGIAWSGILLDVTEERAAALDAERRSDRLSALVAALERMHEQTLGTVVQDIRDGVGGNLSVLKMSMSGVTARLPTDDADLAGKVQGINRLIDRTMDLANRIARDLRPGVIDIGLVETLGWQCEAFETRTGLPCELTVSGDAGAVPVELTLSVYRMVEDALSNVAQHAGASRVDVTARCEAGVLVITVSDDGRGVSDADLADARGVGVLRLTERARAFGGDVEVLGLPERGTRLTLGMPLEGPLGDGRSSGSGEGGAT